MFNRDKELPTLKGFTSGGSGRGKSLSSPTTSLWLAIIFVAMIFALISVRKNINNAQEAMKPPQVRHSGWIVDAPEQVEALQPPPNPESLFPKEEEMLVSTPDLIELTKEERAITLRPIDVPMNVSVPKNVDSANVEIN